MLYGLGLIVLLLSVTVEAESVLVPFAIASIGILLMAIGKRTEGGHETE